MSQSTQSNTSYATIAEKALKHWQTGEHSLESGDQLACFALYKAHFETNFPNNVHIPEWVNIDGKVEKARAATFNDTIMEVVFGFIEGKAGKNSPNGYTKAQINRVTRVVPAVIAAISLGDSTLQLNGNNRLMVDGALLYPDDVDQHGVMYPLGGTSSRKDGRTMAEVIRNSKKLLGMTKDQQTTTTGDRNHTTTGNDTTTTSDSKPSSASLADIFTASARAINSHDSIAMFSKENGEAFACLARELHAMLLETGEGFEAILHDSNLSDAETFEALKALYIDNNAQCAEVA